MSEKAAQRESDRGRSSRAVFFVYKRIVSPLLHAVSGSVGACRFQPTCSEYAALAIEYHGVFRGTWLALCRVVKCHPFHRPEFDPVPGTWTASSSGAAAVMQSSVQPDTIEQAEFVVRAALRPAAKLPDERR